MTTTTPPKSLFARHTRTEASFSVLSWAEAEQAKAIDFWSRRGFAFGPLVETTLTAARGSLWGNLTSFDVTKLQAHLTLTHSPAGELRAVLDVNTMFQFLTDWNHRWLQLELECFETFLLGDDEQAERVKRFRAKYNTASLKWALTAGLAGRKIPPGEEP